MESSTRRPAGRSRRVRSAAFALTATVVGLAATTAVVPPIAHAASTAVYVAQDGSDAGNTCAVQSAPCATVTHALTQAAPGVTVHVSGTVRDNVSVPSSLSPVTITGTAGSPGVLDGGGTDEVLFNQNSLTLRHLVVQNGLGHNGGGIANFGNLVLDRATVRNNSGYTGGGIYSWYGSVTVVDSTITGNVADGGFGGGAIWTGGGPITVLRSTLSDNTVHGGYGGAIDTYDTSAVTITDSTVSGNSAPQAGGISSGNLTVTRSTITGNSASFGAGIWNPVGVVTITQSTIAGNLGTGILNNYGEVKVAGSILGPNTQASCTGNTPNTWTSGGYNVVSDGSCPIAGTGDVVNADPQLGALADNGGGTRTMMPASGSTAVGRIPTGAAAHGVAMCPRYDQRGVPAPVSGQTACTSGSTEPAAFVLTDQAPLVVTSTSGTYGQPLALTSSGGSGEGAVSFTATNGTAAGCTVNGSAQLTSTTAGTCIVTATKQAWGVFRQATSAPTAVTFAKLEQQALAVTSLFGTAGTPLVLTTSGGSGTGAVTYAAVNGTASGCTVSPAPPYSLTVATSGTCLVTATKAGDVNHLPRSSAQTAVTMSPAAQTQLVLTSTSGTFGMPLALTTSGGSGAGAVTYAAANGSATGCTVTASAPWTLTSTSAGTCTVTATKAADGIHAATSSVPTTVSLAKATQAALVVTSTSGTFGTPLTLTTSGGTGTGAVTYAVVDGTASGCTVSASAPWTLTADSAGTCTVTASKAGDVSYLPRSSSPTTVTLGKATQAPVVVTSTSGTWGEPVELTSSGGSGTGAVTYAVVDGTASGCTVSDIEPWTLSADSAGTCTVTATKAGDGDYLPRSSTPTAVTLARATQAPLVVTSTSGTVGTPLELTSSGGSGTGAVTYAAVDGTASGCTVSASAPWTLSATSAGTCTVTATKAGDGNHEPVSSSPTAVAFAAAPVSLPPPAPQPVDATVPGAVRKLVVGGKAGATRRLVDWVAPSTDGGSPVTGYQVVVRKGTKKVLATTVSGSKFTLRRAKLPAGKLTVVVRARNAEGLGAAVSARFTVRK